MNAHLYNPTLTRAIQSGKEEEERRNQGEGPGQQTNKPNFSILFTGDQI